MKLLFMFLISFSVSYSFAQQTASGDKVRGGFEATYNFEFNGKEESVDVEFSERFKQLRYDAVAHTTAIDKIIFSGDPALSLLASIEAALNIIVGEEVSYTVQANTNHIDEEVKFDCNRQAATCEMTYFAGSGNSFLKGKDGLGAGDSDLIEGRDATIAQVLQAHPTGPKARSSEPRPDFNNLLHGDVPFRIHFGRSTVAEIFENTGICQFKVFTGGENGGNLGRGRSSTCSLVLTSKKDKVLTSKP